MLKVLKEIKNFNIILILCRIIAKKYTKVDRNKALIPGRPKVKFLIKKQ